MNKIIIILGGVTYAMKLKKLLLREGIRSKQVKLSNAEAYNGCVYGIEIERMDFLRAVVIMKENGIQYSVHNKDDL